MNCHMARITHKNFEESIKASLARSGPEREADLRATLENIQLLAISYGDKAPHEDATHGKAISALNTIATLAGEALKV